MSAITFFNQLLREPGKVGAITRSSRDLADYMTKVAGVDTAGLVVEYGPGTGSITRSIMEQASQDSKVICLEINERFVDYLQKKFPGLDVRNDSATKIRKHIADEGHETCDAIVSGLPFAIFDDELQAEILEETYEALAPGGKFVTFGYCSGTYLPKGRRFQKNLVKQFKSYETSPVIWKNFPPAYVFCATKS